MGYSQTTQVDITFYQGYRHSADAAAIVLEDLPRVTETTPAQINKYYDWLETTQGTVRIEWRQRYLGVVGFTATVRWYVGNPVKGWVQIASYASGSAEGEVFRTHNVACNWDYDDQIWINVSSTAGAGNNFYIQDIRLRAYRTPVQII